METAKEGKPMLLRVSVVRQATGGGAWIAWLVAFNDLGSGIVEYATDQWSLFFVMCVKGEWLLSAIGLHECKIMLLKSLFITGW